MGEKGPSRVPPWSSLKNVLENRQIWIYSLVWGLSDMRFQRNNHFDFHRAYPPLIRVKHCKNMFGMPRTVHLIFFLKSAMCRFIVYVVSGLSNLFSNFSKILIPGVIAHHFLTCEQWLECRETSDQKQIYFSTFC